MASPKAASAIQPLLSVGRYEIYDRIAAGGMAAVHVGMLLVGAASGLARPVAIKRLHPHLAEDPEFVAMFLDEAKLAARLSHPNVVPTLDVITQGKEVFLVMEYVAGESLATVLRLLNERRQLPPVEIIAAVVADALRGLGSAHRATNELGKPLGIVHRDISPQNVMVGADGVSRLLDFGIAKAADRAQYTREGQIRGKIAYMAPEQLRGTPASARTDLYSMGVVLWESLTARRLFHAATDAKLVSRVLECDVRPASEHNPSVPPALDALLERALHRNPDVRFQHADEMASELDAAVQPTLRRDVGTWLHGLASDSLDRRANQIQAYVKAFALRHPPAPVGAREAGRQARGAPTRGAPARPRSGEPPPPSGPTMPTMLSPSAMSGGAPGMPGAPGRMPGTPGAPGGFGGPASPAAPSFPENGRMQTPKRSSAASAQPWRAPNLPASSQPPASTGRPSPTSLLVAQGRAWVMPRGPKTAGPLPLAATPLATPSAKRRAKRPIPSPLQGGLALAIGVLLGGVLARAYLFYRDATLPRSELTDVVEITPPTPVLAPTDLPPADPPPTRRKGTPSPASSAPRRELAIGSALAHAESQNAGRRTPPWLSPLGARARERALGCTKGCVIARPARLRVRSSGIHESSRRAPNRPGVVGCTRC